MPKNIFLDITRRLLNAPRILIKPTELNLVLHPSTFIRTCALSVDLSPRHSQSVFIVFLNGCPPPWTSPRWPRSTSFLVYRSFRPYNRLSSHLHYPAVPSKIRWQHRHLQPSIVSGVYPEVIGNLPTTLLVEPLYLRRSLRCFTDDVRFVNDTPVHARASNSQSQNDERLSLIYIFSVPSYFLALSFPFFLSLSLLHCFQVPFYPHSYFFFVRLFSSLLFFCTSHCRWERPCLPTAYSSFETGCKTHHFIFVLSVFVSLYFCSLFSQIILVLHSFDDSARL